jgi:hypothetical protein
MQYTMISYAIRLNFQQTRNAADVGKYNTKYLPITNR